MSILRKAILRIRSLFAKRRLDAEMDEEMRAHLDLQTEENMADGMSAEEARYAALRQFGHVEGIQEACRDQRGWVRLENLARDFRYAGRQLRKSPGFAVTAVLILAVGMAANTTVFSLVNAALFQPLPVREPDQLAQVTIPYAGSTFSSASFQTLRAQRGAFQDMTAYARELALCRVDDQQSRVPIELISGNYFAFLGLTPQLGRLLDSSDEDAPDVVISDRWWQREFNRDPNIIGRAIELNNKPFTIVGVARPGFGGMRISAPVEAWITTGMKGSITPDEVHDARGRWLSVVARLKPGVSLAAAQAALQAIEKEVMEPWMFTGSPRKDLELRPCGRGLIPAEERSAGRLIAGFLFTVMALVLVVACANLASLLVCRGINRRREVAVRLALGASRFRVVQQLLVETLLISLLGGALGLLMSTWGVKLLAAVVPSTVAGFSFNFTFSYEPRVVAYALALSVVTALACGLVPALQGTKPELQSSLKDETQGLTVRTRWYDLRNLLVVGQVAVCVVLLVGGGLILRSLVLMQKADLGFDYHSCLAAAVWNRDHATPEAEYTDRLGELIRTVQTLPGVKAACVCSHPPFGSDMIGTSVAREEDRSQWESVMYNAVTPGFFATLKIPIWQGRDFGPRDNLKSDKVVIIDQALAQRFWPDENPLGRRIFYGQTPYEVVGVVGNAFAWSVAESPQPGLYFCFNQFPNRGNPHLLLRVNGPMRPLRGLVAGLVRQADPGHQPSLVQPYKDIMLTAFFPQRATAWVLGLASLVGLGLVCLGLYGVLSYHVAQRTREIGLRLALGAQRSQVLAGMLRRGLILAGFGLGTGLGLSILAAHVLSRLLYHIQPADPLTFGAVGLLILLITGAACFFPARRAANVNPMAALRYE